MADAADSKSVARKGVWVQVPPPALRDAVSRRRPFPVGPPGAACETPPTCRPRGQAGSRPGIVPVEVANESVSSPVRRSTER